MSKKNGNGINLEEKIPTAKELRKMYPLPKKLTPQMERLKQSTEKAMEALDLHIQKYGYPPDFRH